MEEYKVIPFEDNYEVSDLGNVRRIDTGHIKSLRYNRGGYLRVTLYPSGKTYSIHQLVGRVWLESSNADHLQIDHINSIRDDNRVPNLEWVTQSENVRRIKNRPCKKGSNNDASVIDEETAYLIKYSFDKTNNEVVEEFKVTKSVVEHIRRRERWTHVVDVEKETRFVEGELRYERTKGSNMTKGDSLLLDNDIEEGVLSTKELTEIYGVSKATICRRRRKRREVT